MMLQSKGKIGRPEFEVSMKTQSEPDFFWVWIISYVVKNILTSMET